MPRPRTGNPVGRPFTYTTDEERPTSVSVRIPHDLHAQAKRDVRLRHPMTLTELLLDGLRLRLATPVDPRDMILSDDNTVIQELQDMIRAAVQAEVGKLSDVMGPHLSTSGLLTGALTPEISYENNTVIQESYDTPTSTEQPVEASVDVPDFDHDRFVLGKLCKGAHTWGTTGKTLLTLSGRKCPQCQTEQQRQRREAKRQAPSA